MSPQKRPRLDHSDEDISDAASHRSLAGGDEPSASGSARESEAESSGSSPDTEDEIAGAKQGKSKKTLKRKRRATDAVRFGSTLQSLLSTSTPSTLPLSLKPSVARKRNDDKLEQKGKKVLQVEKKEKEEKSRIKDVIGGWGGESERALRKVAQRGVVKLFNVIQQSQAANAAEEEELKSHRGTGKPTLPAPRLDSKSKGKKSRSAGVTESKREQPLAGEDFFDIIRSGGIVSKT